MLRLPTGPGSVASVVVVGIVGIAHRVPPPPRGLTARARGNEDVEGAPGLVQPHRPYLAGCLVGGTGGGKVGRLEVSLRALRADARPAYEEQVGGKRRGGIVGGVGDNLHA